jgi:guanylate kinase
MIEGAAVGPPLLIVLEGPDGSGKTTLASRLVFDFDLNYHHEGPPPTNALSELAGSHRDLWPMTVLEHYQDLLRRVQLKRTVFDRFALGERVYGPILRGRDAIGAFGWSMIMKQLEEYHNSIFIFCLPPVSVAMSNWRVNAKNELFSGDERYLETYARFAYFASRIQGLVFDYTEDTYASLAKKIRKQTEICT